MRNLPQDDNWESREQSLGKVKLFFEQILKIGGAANIVIVEAHRLHVAQRRPKQPL